MKEGYSKSKPAPAVGFNPALTAGKKPEPAGRTNSALDTGSSQVPGSLSTPSSAEVDTGTDPHPGCACHAGRKKHRSTAEERDLITRLNRIEGQIRGIKKMLEADAYCPDVLTQVAAARCAMNSFSKVLLASHIRSCVVEDLEAGREETIEELVDTVQKLLKA
ncbi:MAG: metal-sensing transcriptional repressor [Lachnospiraceae bacterium]|nr:metal-sensing transcriptional repressor [Lachnospiraceae bacterium]